MHVKPVPIISLCGFLGSGKTTLLRRWRSDDGNKDAPVIVHDLSEFGLDAELLADESSPPALGRLVGRVAALHGPHAREHLHVSLGRALDEIFELNPAPALVFCESTGAALPWPLIKALTQDKRFFLRHFIVTVDALNLHRDFADGSILTGEASELQDIALRHASEVLAEQIIFASVIILTKIDMIPKAAADVQVRTLQKFQPNATIALSGNAGINLPQLEPTPAPKFSVLKKLAEQFGLTQKSSTANNVEAIVFRESRPFHPERLYEACRNKLGTGLYRTKGFLWLASRSGHVLMWQQSGSQISLELSGYWRAEIVYNRDGNLSPEEVDYLNAQLKTNHPVFGDRHNELTLIGLKADRESFALALKEAICTDEEVKAWQNGEVFTDPWPKSLRRV